jgi:hypothetical protein
VDLGESEPHCRDVLARCRERLALAMTRLNQAHWELDRLVEEWLAHRDVSPGWVTSAKEMLRWATSDYDKAFAEVIGVLSSEDCSAD